MREEYLHLAEVIILALTLLFTVYALRKQGKEAARAQELSATATLFQYYNAKISSLRESIVRDTGNPNRAQLDPLEKREADLTDFRAKHKRVLVRLERLYGELADE